MSGRCGRGGAALLALLALLAAGACGDAERPLRIGAKDFTEQLLLAEMMAQLCEQQGIPIERRIPLGDTFITYAALEEGRIDLYPEYTGTTLSLAGRRPPADSTQALAEARQLVEPLGLRWGPRFGFANSYAMVMRRDRAVALGVERLSDLARLPAGIRFAASASFLQRPVDGLGALARRYGLQLRDTLVFVDGERTKVFQALLDNEVDVAEAYSTDEQIDAYGLQLLADDLGFFPPYEPAPLYRQQALERWPALQRVLDQLAGSIDAQAMRRLIRRVDTSGHPYPEVARAFLVERGLSPADGTAAGKELRPLLLAVGEVDEQGTLPVRALRAVRQVMAKRDVRVRAVAQPLAEVVSGRARLAVTGADAFFTADGTGGVRALGTAEALGVVGYHMAHLLCASGARFHALPQLRRLGVGPAQGAAHRAAAHIARAHGLDQTLQLIPATSIAQQLEALDRGELDGLLLMVSPGHPLVGEAMRSGRYALRPLGGDHAEARLLHLPFLRLARVPAHTYEHQPEAFETYSVQVVLAGPAPRASSRLGEVGPGYIPGLDPSAPLPIAGPVARQLSAALGSDERIDPVLPCAAALAPRSTPTRAVIEPAPLDSLVNLLAICFVAYLVLLFLREERSRRAGHERRPLS